MARRTFEARAQPVLPSVHRRNRRVAADPAAQPADRRAARGGADVTQGRARTVANAVLVSAAVAAAVVVFTTPPLRRLAGQWGRYWLGGSLAQYLVAEARRAWVESARAA